MNNYLPLIFALLLSMIHLFAYKWELLSKLPRSIWLSIGGGISTTYVFLHLIPELHESQKLFNSVHWGPIEDNHVFFVMLIGLVFFYGLERLVRNSQKKKKTEEERNPSVFWMHVLSFAVYNFIIGYVLKEQTPTWQKGCLYFMAMGAHFLVNDFGFQQHYRHLYVKEARWILSFSILGGWFCNKMLNISQFSLTILLALLAGGVVLNVLKEELPEERESCFWAFFLGTSLYGLIFVLL